LTLQPTRKSWRNKAIILIIVWIVLIVGSVTVFSTLVVPFLRTFQNQKLVSVDWGGYGVSSNFIFPEPQVTSVSGSWIVPAVAVSERDTFSAIWLGIGGQTEPTLIQIGSQQNSVKGQTEYSLWYEMLPAYSITIENIAVSPGDKITAAVRLADSSTNNWLMEINDITTGESFSQTVYYNSSKLSAEWVIERPKVNDQVTTLANFGSITFTDIKAQIGDQSGTIIDFSSYAILMEDSTNRGLVRLSDPTKDGSSFTVTYG
jgi:hypothetical protein